MRAYHIYLLRHGMTVANSEGRYIGRMDVPLTKEGRKQLEDMAGKYDYPLTDVYFSSPMKRCLESLDILYPGAEPVIVDNFSECDFGEFEGKTFEELKKDEQYQKWTSGASESAPNGESSKSFQVRCCGAFESIVERLLRTGSYTAVIMAHGGTLMSILGAFAFPRRPMYEWITKNGMGYEIIVTPQLWMSGRVVEVGGIVPFNMEESSEKEKDGIDE